MSEHARTPGRSAAGGRARRSGPPRGVLASVLLGTLLAAAPCAPAHAEDEACTRVFDRFEKAWRDQDPAGVVAGMDADGTLRLRLLAPPGADWKTISGDLKRENARRTLKSYFDRVQAPRLTLRVPKEGTKALPHVRHYDYSFRPTGGEPVTSRLTVTLKRKGEGSWCLGSVEESAIPR